jgi:D-glycero-alpha-D-manno-heptose 1-phosphate guanylyltransferase
MEAIILAGGKGTRLRELIADIPKPMAPVNDKPFIDYVLNWLKQYPVEKIILSVGFKANKITDYLGDSYNNIPIEYVIEGKPLGTGGAVRYALQKAKGENVLILNGDTYFPIDLNKFFAFHKENNNLFSIALKRMKDFSRYGSVECNENTIVRFNEKKLCPDGLINGGIYLVNRSFIESKQLPEVFSLETDILESDAKTALLKCMEFDDLFIDIGIPEDYLRAKTILKIS